MSGDESKHLQDDHYHYNMDVTGDEKMVERILSGKVFKRRDTLFDHMD